MGRLCLLGEFRHADGQDTIFVPSRRFRLIDVVDVERTAHRSRAALTAYVIALLVLLVIILRRLRGNRQVMVLIRQGDILFLEARQFSRELIARAVILQLAGVARERVLLSGNS